MVMELNKIEKLLEKYFEGETTISEEKELKTYFLSNEVVQHLKQYQSLFGYFTHEKEVKFVPKIVLKPTKKRHYLISIAASVVVFLGIGTYIYFNESTVNSNDLGTYDTPEEAFEATQKALSLLSNNLQFGIESVGYINEYESTKNIIFK